ncbi:swi-snf complex subunit [Grosmannia clavigera kw1407]|uniref:Swi-snf complex subunit n=1 Tax=Grosmannia clavigera (strain kw1407 / UAMH 11150) TaxID=655863 RepID=F0XPW3_GROCL|nr:swi-snf complex subunit [Grosmannia clavigera kw1407]EFX00631.1 swi-snf complex subunit [Grosmannia clavigera kw1407]
MSVSAPPPPASSTGSSPRAGLSRDGDSGGAVAASASAAASAAASVSAASSGHASPVSPATKPAVGRDRDTFDRILVERYVTRDGIHSAALQAAQVQMQKDFRSLHMFADDYRKLRSDYRPWFPARQLYGEGYAGLGNGYTEVNGPSRILYPMQKTRPGKRQTPALKYSRKDMAQQAEQHEELVPIRLDVEWDKIKLRDTFTWNLHDRLVAPELFTTQLMEDLGLRPPAATQVYEQISQQIHEQLTDFYPLVCSDEDALDPELPYSAYKNDEMRILVKLNITIGQHTLVDQFEWEINNPMNSPEEFAAGMARDLSLSGEFTTAIAHCIREQAQLFTRGLYSVGHAFDGRPVEDPDLVAAFLPSPLPAVFRPQQQAKEYAPYLYELSEAELERNELTFSREQRRQKRSVNRRGGPILPDLKDRQRTIRTLIVSSVLPGAAADVDESRLYKRAAGASGRRRGGRDGDLLSDSDESDDSSPDSPSTSQHFGSSNTAAAAAAAAAANARTRGIRGAATAAQQRMAVIGRSETPEASTIHHHETRTARRTTRDLRDDSVDEPARLIVTIRVSKDRLRKLMRDLRARPPPGGTPSLAPLTPSLQQLQQPLSHAHQQLQLQQQLATPMGPPPTTPSGRHAAAPSRSAIPHGHLGRLPAAPPPASEADAPPAWLLDALQRLRDRAYPNDSFEGVMRYSVFNREEQLVPAPRLGEPLENYRFWYLPRIRCHDCPGKLYTPGPEMTVGNFEVHLKNRFHREKVEQRLVRDASRQPSGQQTATSTASNVPPPPLSSGRSASGTASPAPIQHQNFPSAPTQPLLLQQQHQHQQQQQQQLQQQQQHQQSAFSPAPLQPQQSLSPSVAAEDDYDDASMASSSPAESASEAD